MKSQLVRSSILIWSIRFGFDLTRFKSTGVRDILIYHKVVSGRLSIWVQLKRREGFLGSVNGLNPRARFGPACEGKEGVGEPRSDPTRTGVTCPMIYHNAGLWSTIAGSSMALVR